MESFFRDAKITPCSTIREKLDKCFAVISSDPLPLPERRCYLPLGKHLEVPQFKRQHSVMDEVEYQEGGFRISSLHSLIEFAELDKLLRSPDKWPVTIVIQGDKMLIHHDPPNASSVIARPWPFSIDFRSFWSILFGDFFTRFSLALSIS